MGLFDKLTDRQEAVYKFIREKIRGRGYGPTVREIAAEFGIRSPNGVVCHLRALVKKGFIGASRTCRGRSSWRPSRPASGLRLAGRIAAGTLHEAIEQDERVDFEAMFDPEAKNCSRSGRGRLDDRGPDCRRRLRGRAEAAHCPEGPDRRGLDRWGRSDAQAMVSRKETASASNRPTRR